MGFQGAWSSLLNFLQIPQGADPDGPAVIITGPEGMPPCLAADYNAAILWRPSGNLSFDVPYWFLAASIDDVGSVDEGFVQYDPGDGLCRVWVTGKREAGIFGGTVIDMLYDFGPLVIPGGFTGSQTTRFQPHHEIQIGAPFQVPVDDSSLIVWGDVLFDHFEFGSTLVNGEFALSANSFGVGYEYSADTAIFTTNSATYTTTGGNVVGTAFRVPMMGNVHIQCSARVGHNTLNTSAYVSPQIREGATLGSGTIVQNGDDNFSCEYNGVVNGAVMSSFGFRFQGTPGAEYNIRLLHRTPAGTASIGRRRVTVSPELTSYYS